MNYIVNCNCGRQTSVTAAAAGTHINCLCGKSVAVPSFSELQRSPESVEPPEQNSDQSGANSGVLVIAIIGLVMMLGALAFLRPGLIMAGWMIIQCGSIWLSVRILRAMQIGPAILVLIVPLMWVLFVVKRFDVAWPPVAMMIGGYALGIIGLCLL